MKRKILPGLLISVLSIGILSASEPSIMTVNGEEIPVSEFKYLFKKNSEQQLEPLTLYEYLAMFEVYRLKVAEAKSQGKDTTESFRKEMAQYRRELAQPYLVDSAEIYKFIDIAANRDKEEVEASHIMIGKARDAQANKKSRERLDSIRTAILNGADFTEMAVKFSQDRSVMNNSGYLGYISSGRFPYSFETAVFESPEGSVSEVIESPVGYHLVKTGKRRPSRGKVEASHIMAMIPKNATPEYAEQQKVKIDSIYQIVKVHPERFGELAKELSDDKGSARQEGLLPLFGAGEMVPEFEEVAFAMEVGEISEPVKSPFGWHIIKKSGKKGNKSYNEVKEDVLKKISNPQDSRFSELKKSTKQRMMAKHNASLDSEAVARLKHLTPAEMDQLLHADWTTIPSMPQSIGEIDGKKVPVSSLIPRMKKASDIRPELDEETIDILVDATFDEALNKAEEDWLYANNEDYRNLINEYTDGSMLYEVSVENVWDKAAKDQEGLKKYFEEHRDHYKWDTLYAKGLLVMVVNDSIGNLIKAESRGLTVDSIIPMIKSKYQGKAQVEKFIVPKGVNDMIDHIMFGGRPVKTKSKNFTEYFVLDGRILDKPEEMNDVRGAVTSDYQEELEKEWIGYLRNKYPVKVNQKEVKKLRKETEKLPAMKK